MGLCCSTEKKEYKKTQGQSLSSSPSNGTLGSTNPQKPKSVDAEEARRLRLEAVEKRLKESKYRGTQNGGGALLAKLEKQNKKPAQSNDSFNSSHEGGLHWVVDG